MKTLKKISEELIKLVTETTLKMAAFILMPEEKPIKVKKMKGESNMNKQTGRKAILALIVVCSLILITGCDNSISNKPDNELTASGQRGSSVKNFNNSIFCEISLSFGKESMTISRILESNIGTNFRNIKKLDTILAGNCILDLQAIQPSGIFAVYLNSEGDVELSNSDGMNIRMKSILLEKCSFIDLKVKNVSSGKIRIKGLVAGE